MRERNVHPDVAEPLDVGRRERRLTRAMVDVATWTALREQGLDPGEAVAAMSAMLACQVDPGHQRARRARR